MEYHWYTTGWCLQPWWPRPGDDPSKPLGKIENLWMTSIYHYLPRNIKIYGWLLCTIIYLEISYVKKWWFSTSYTYCCIPCCTPWTSSQGVGRQVTVIFLVRAHAAGDNAQQAPGVTTSLDEVKKPIGLLLKGYLRISNSLYKWDSII